MEKSSVQKGIPGSWKRVLISSTRGRCQIRSSGKIQDRYDSWERKTVEVVVVGDYLNCFFFFLLRKGKRRCSSCRRLVVEVVVTCR